MKRILVLGAGGPASYNFIKSLRQAPEKFYIVGLDKNPYHLELAPVDKRYAGYDVENPLYLVLLEAIIEKEKIDFVHCQSDPEVKFLSWNREKINAKTLLPRATTIADCQDKLKTNEVLRKAGVPVPLTFPIIEKEHDGAVPYSRFSLKLHLDNILKPMLKVHEQVWIRASRGAGSRASLPVRRVEHAKMWIDWWREMKGLQYGDFMVSEFLPGPEYAFQSFWINGKLIMSQARERMEYLFGNLTPHGQSSSPSVARTVHNDEVNDVALRAIEAIDEKATGIFCVDMKTDKDGQVKVTEINAGRFFTTSLFFTTAGMNMPYYYTKAGLGEKVAHNLKPFNNIPPNWYWVRMMDMGYKLIKNKWKKNKE